MSFDYSTMRIGDDVEVSTQPDFSSPVAGVVTTADPSCCFIQVQGSPHPPLEFCWHEDDDRMADGFEVFMANQDLYSGPDQLMGPRTGVFRKARSQILLDTLGDRLDAIDRALARLVGRMSAIETMAETFKRRPGRPKTPRQEAAGVS